LFTPVTESARHESSPVDLQPMPRGWGDLVRLRFRPAELRNSARTVCPRETAGNRRVWFGLILIPAEKRTPAPAALIRKHP